MSTAFERSVTFAVIAKSLRPAQASPLGNYGDTHRMAAAVMLQMNVPHRVSTTAS